MNTAIELTINEQEKSRIARNEYFKKYRKKNKDKIKEINNRYWMKKFNDLNKKEET